MTPERLDRPFTDPLVGRIFLPLATGVHWGLERITAALDDLGDPHLSYPTIHVGGTNGKGSVAAVLASVMCAEGHKVGLYTSPHLCHFHERFQVCGRPLPDDVIEARGLEIRELIAWHGLTFFEATTALAFHAFRREDLDVVVVEVGLGGRLDATNVVQPIASIITNIAMDHADFLGATVEEVAREKAGIIKAGVPILTAEANPAVVELLRATASRRAAPFFALDPVNDLHHVEVGRECTEFTVESRSWGALRLATPLVGRHQALNAALAVEVLEHLPTGLQPDAASVREGVASVRWPGRDQIIETPRHTLLIDVAHNTAGVLSLVDVLDQLDLPRPWVALVGVLGDKDWPAMLPPLFRRVDEAVLTQPPSAPAWRRWNPVDAARAAAESPEDAVCPVRIEENLSAAFELARDAAGTGTLIVTGSVYTVGGALTHLAMDLFEGPV